MICWCSHSWFGQNQICTYYLIFFKTVFWERTFWMCKMKKKMLSRGKWAICQPLIMGQWCVPIFCYKKLRQKEIILAYEMADCQTWNHAFWWSPHIPGVNRYPVEEPQPPETWRPEKLELGTCEIRIWEASPDSLCCLFFSDLCPTSNNWTVFFQYKIPSLEKNSYFLNPINKIYMSLHMNFRLLKILILTVLEQQ